MIKVRNLSAYYKTVQGTIKAVEQVTFDIFNNEIVGIAGESGCGKSTLMKAIYGNFSYPMYIQNGSLSLTVNENGHELEIPGEEIHQYWWKYISYIPQASMSVLNPVLRIKDQFLDSFSKTDIRSTGKEKLVAKMAAYLEDLELPSDVLNSFPHQLSGGMRQRVIVALATFTNPQFVLADEPTTALDVVVQRGILSMLVSVQQKMQNTFIMVSHDMGVHYQITNRMMIMYAGRIAEICDTETIFTQPLHPYTKLLIDSLPRLGDNSTRTGISGRPPSLLNPPDGCRFAARCPMVIDRCRAEVPDLREVTPGHFVACHRVS